MSLALHQPTTFMPFFAAACSPSSSGWSSSSLTDSSRSELLRCFSGRAPVEASSSFPLFFPFPPTPCSGSRRSVVPSPAAARSTAGGSMGTAVTASDVSSGRSLTDSVASNEPAIVAATMRNNEKSYASQSAAGQPGVKTEVFHPTQSGGAGCWPTGGCPPPGAPPTRDRRENPTEREVIDLNPRTAPRRPERDPPDVSHGGSKL